MNYGDSQERAESLVKAFKETFVAAAGFVLHALANPPQGVTVG